MFIAHVQFSVASPNRQQALDTLKAEIPVVRAMPGCKLFLPFADAIGEGGLGVIHEWDAAEDFAAYVASTAFATLGQVLRPLMTAAPVSRRFNAAPVETLTH